ncbi:MAG: thiopurine S-methyltransferase [Balneolaceae bacterium]
MELSYWRSRWNQGKIGFHSPEVYEGLRQALEQLPAQKNRHVLVPLCGKSIDMVWLAEQGHRVTGVELSEKAVQQFFEEQGLPAERSTRGRFTLYRSGSITLWCGDFFSFPQSEGPFDWIYDKASLVALPPDMRSRYAEKLKTLRSKETVLLLHHFIYPQEQMPGPPFSVENDELSRLFGKQWHFEEMYSRVIEPSSFPKFQARGLKDPIYEHFYKLSSPS